MSLTRVRWQSGGLLLLALTASALVWFDRDAVTTGEHRSREHNLLVAFRHADIEEIRLERPGEASILLRRDPQDPDLHAFELIGNADLPNEAPPATTADPAIVARLLSALEFATYERKLTDDVVDEDALGFGDPPLVLRVDMGSLSYRVLFGGPVASQPDARYVRVSGQGVDTETGIVAGSLLDALSIDRRDFGGDLLLPTGRNSTASLTLESGDTRAQLVRDSAGFKLADGTRVDRQTLDRLFFALARSKIESYPEGAVRLETTDVLSIVQAPREGTPVRLELGQRCPDRKDLVLARRDGDNATLGCIASSVRSTLEGELTRLPSRTLVPLASDEIDHVRIELRGRRLDLVRRDREFLLTSPVERTLDQETGTSFLDALTGLSATLLATASEGGPKSPTDSAIGTLEVIGASPLANETVRFELELQAGGGASDEDPAFVVRKDDGRILELPPDLSRWLRPSTPWYEPRRLVRAQEKDVVSLEISLEGTVTEVLTQKDGELLRRGGDRADTGLAHDALMAISHLEVERWLSGEESDEPAGTPHLMVRFILGVDGKRVTDVLRVGERVRGGRRASLASRPGGFVLPLATVRRLERSLRDRGPAFIEPQTISTLRIDAKTGTYEFERKGLELRERGKSSSELGEALAEAMTGLFPLFAATEATAEPSEAPELRLSGTTTTPTGQPQSFEITLGRVHSVDGREVQILRRVGVPGAFYVDRARVLSLLDLL